MPSRECVSLLFSPFSASSPPSHLFIKPAASLGFHRDLNPHGVLREHGCCSTKNRKSEHLTMGKEYKQHSLKCFFLLVRKQPRWLRKLSKVTESLENITKAVTQLCPPCRHPLHTHTHCQGCLFQKNSVLTLSSSLLTSGRKGELGRDSGHTLTAKVIQTIRKQNQNRFQETESSIWFGFSISGPVVCLHVPEITLLYSPSVPLNPSSLDR